MNYKTKKDWIDDNFGHISVGEKIEQRSGCKCFRTDVEGQPAHWECGLGVTRKEDGIRWCCFKPSCSLGAGVSSAGIRERVKHHRAGVATPVGQPISLPAGYAPILHGDADLWLQQYNITTDELSVYGVGTDEASGRIVFPIKDDKGNVVYYQSRNIQHPVSGGAKWENPKGVKSPVFTSRFNGQSNNGVIVEDVLSAIVVGRLAPACAVLGTSVSDYKLNAILKWRKKHNIKNLTILLDADATDKAYKLKKQLTGFFNNVTVHENMGADPKTWSEDDFKSKGIV